MGLFSKTEYKTVLMDYRFKEEDGFPFIQAIGNKDIESLELLGWGFFDCPTDS